VITTNNSTAASHKEAKFRQLANSRIFCDSGHRVSRDLQLPSSGISARVEPKNNSHHWRYWEKQLSYLF